MTLCVAWKYSDPRETTVCFAADSCVSVLTDDHQHFRMPYGGIKVLPIPLRIIPPGTNIPGPPEQPFEAVYGLAFSGDYAAAFLIKESIADMLQHGQLAGPMETLSFETICRLVHRLYSHYHEELRTHLRQREETMFFLGGLCPRAGVVKVAKFPLDNETGEPTWEEVLREGAAPCDAIGSDAAVERFKVLFQLSLTGEPCRVHFAALHRLREIMRDPEHPGVDGAIQYGSFGQTGNFELMGSFDLAFEDGRLVHKAYMRGTDFDELLEAQGIGDLYVQYPLIQPFQEDALAFVHDHVWYADGRGYPVDELITVVPFDHRWVEHYQEEAGLLQIQFNNASIEHIGSTAVPNTPARPVIDIMVGVPNFDAFNARPLDLSRRHFDDLRDYGVPGRRFYRKRVHPGIDLQVVQHDSPLWRAHLSLRDFLRAQPEAAREFGRVKLRILNEGSWTLQRYLTRRRPHIEGLLAEANRPR